MMWPLGLCTWVLWHYFVWRVLPSTSWHLQKTSGGWGIWREVWLLMGWRNTPYVFANAPPWSFNSRCDSVVDVTTVFNWQLLFLPIIFDSFSWGTCQLFLSSDVAHPRRSDRPNEQFNSVQFLWCLKIDRCCVYFSDRSPTIYNTQ